MSSSLSQPEVRTGAPEGGARLRVVGCGNSFAADDAAGLEVIRRLRACGEWDCELLEMPQAGVELMEILDGAQTVVFVDAVSSVALPGTIHLVSLPSQAVQPRALGSFSSHGWGLAETLQLRTALGRALPRLFLVGIEIETCVAGGPLSPMVLEAIRIIVGRFAALCEIVKPERAITWKIPWRFPPGDASFPGRSGDIPIAERGL